MKILPVVCKTIPLMIEGRCVEVPFQVFRSKTSTVIRIGDNALYFDDDGTFDGCEAKGEDPEQAKLYVESLAKKTQGVPPETSYFQPGTPGFHREIQGWATTPVTKGTIYATVPEGDKTPKS